MTRSAVDNIDLDFDNNNNKYLTIKIWDDHTDEFCEIRISKSEVKQLIKDLYSEWRKMKND